MCGIVGFTAPGQDPAAAKQIVQGVQKALIEAEDECNGTADTLSASAIQKPWNPVNTRHTPKK